MIESIDKVFFIPGDLVTIKHDIPNKPTMLVKSKETKTIRETDANHFIGIKCFWFTTEGLYQESIYNTKDLEKVEPYKKLKDNTYRTGTSIATPTLKNY